MTKLLLACRQLFSVERRAQLRYLGIMCILVASGGALGGLLRWGLSELWQPGNSQVPWSILFVNVVGSAVLGIVTTVVTERYPDRPGISAFFGTGMMGGFTTFSTVMVGAITISMSGGMWCALLWLVLNVVLSIIAAVTAMFLTSLVLGRDKTAKYDVRVKEA